MLIEDLITSGSGTSYMKISTPLTTSPFDPLTINALLPVSSASTPGGGLPALKIDGVARPVVDFIP